jgi:hypothetical protein
VDCGSSIGEEAAMKEQYACVQVYSTRIPVAGWGSTTLLAIAALIVSAVPAAQTLTLVGLLSGAALAVGLIVRRSRARGPETVAGGLLGLLASRGRN